MIIDAVFLPYLRIRISGDFQYFVHDTNLHIVAWGYVDKLRDICGKCFLHRRTWAVPLFGPFICLLLF